MTIPHATFTVEKRLKAPRAKAFAAWQSLHDWYLPSGQLHDGVNEFRVGGRQMHVFGPPGGPVFRTDGRYEDIVEGERIVVTQTTHRNEARASTSICTVEFLDDGQGTRLILTDQSAYYMGDYSAIRRDGWEKILGWLETWMQELV
jgi:uncharacterized protein YndB with AHSA1/START domain